MLKRVLDLLRASAAAALLMAAPAFADPIPGLFPTGIDGLGSSLPVDAADSHYTGSGTPGSFGPIVVTKLGGWASPTGNAMWIGPTASDVSDSDGSYAYDLTFDLTGLDPATAVITGSMAADDGVFVFLNGEGDFGFAPASTLTDFVIDSGFVAGVNTLRFSSGNACCPSFNPTGLLVDALSGTATIPEPGTASLVGAALAVVALTRRRRAAP